MADAAIKKGPPPKPIEELFEEASASVAAETLLQAMGPQLEKAFRFRIQQLFDAPPELGPLLDARAQIKAVWDMKQGLTREMKKGRAAVEVFNNLLLKSV